ncbi:site-specific integrase [Noviherbaspirillum galbum]|uniref:Site-specific integrase n=1 Tax=Noviherbaspirillum galbum TaxID=2709383 RepID=A0A6B3SGV1_9BURK|nr:site-specific integrase [Noviherbaspirillum galbum]NEX60094.1 site-specific integrase [Noviherbaspirillum galbum]
MSDTVNYAVRTTVFEDGERMPVLVDAATGIPLYDPCVYACTDIRPNTGSSATIEQALRGVQFLLTFIGERKIELEGRFASARFLDLHELDDLVRTAYLPMDSTPTGGRNMEVAAPKVISLDKVRSRAVKTRKESTVALSTVAIRLYYAGAYLEWLGHRAARQVCKTLEQKTEYMDLLREFLGRLRSRTPKARGQSSRLSLTAEQKAELLRVVDPRCPDNPWEGEFVRERNRLIVLWGLGTGLRRGELLGLRIKLLNFRRNMAEIVRRPDDKKDPRKYQPNTKTRERGIGISEELAYLTHEHIVKHRSSLRGARKHDFLFVADDTGLPLSLAALSKVFRTLRERHPAVGDGLSSHVLRHTWNEDFSEVADKAGLAPEDERRARNHAMGWSDFSNSSDHYLKRRTRRQATEASVKIQQAVVGEATKGEQDD